MGGREAPSIAYYTKGARFLSYRDLAGFDFTASGINEAIFRQRHRGELIVHAETIVLIDAPGTGNDSLRFKSKQENELGFKP